MIFFFATICYERLSRSDAFHILFFCIKLSGAKTFLNYKNFFKCNYKMGEINENKKYP